MGIRKINQLILCIHSIGAFQSPAAKVDSLLLILLCNDFYFITKFTAQLVSPAQVEALSLSWPVWEGKANSLCQVSLLSGGAKLACSSLGVSPSPQSAGLSLFSVAAANMVNSDEPTALVAFGWVNKARILPREWMGSANPQ